ncbi:hypothetical protein TNCV_444811 [Trichonephila clavipes]|nr:hypothetical protein TNCV_444811 [Trichonephila clavipes]
MSTTYTLIKKIDHLSCTEADRHPVSQRKRCVIGCRIASNSYITLALCFTLFTKVFINPFGNRTHSCTKALLDSPMVLGDDLCVASECSKFQVSAPYVSNAIKIRGHRRPIQSMNIRRLEVFIHQLSLVWVCVIIHTEEI